MVRLQSHVYDTLQSKGSRKIFVVMENMKLLTKIDGHFEVTTPDRRTLRFLRPAGIQVKKLLNRWRVSGTQMIEELCSRNQKKVCRPYECNGRHPTAEDSGRWLAVLQKIQPAT